MTQKNVSRGRWIALTAAILGWMFDGLEMGLFPLVARPALRDLLSSTLADLPAESQEALVGKWFGLLIAIFLIGAATGGVLFGWLGDRLGRVRAMALSIFVYAIFSGLCGFATSAPMILILRFVASLGMGGEWSLGVSLVMELWPKTSKGWLAGLIGAAANVGFILIAVVGLVLHEVIDSLAAFLISAGLPEETVATLVAHDGWRIMMMLGAVPALLTFFIRLYVPESEKWLAEKQHGTTKHWMTTDLWGVLIGSLGPLLVIWLWADDSFSWVIRAIGLIAGIVVAAVGYTYPVIRYIKRVEKDGPVRGVGGRSVMQLMLIGAALSGIALMGTWGSVQWAPAWADSMTDQPTAKAYVQIVLGIGAIIGTIVAAVIGHRVGRRVTFAALCLLSLAGVLALFQLNDAYGTQMLLSCLFAGAAVASFFGWLPLYLPELFPTKVRATGQGFAFNFGRILAAVGTLQTGALMKDVFGGSYPQACSWMSLIYLVGFVIIWFAPETHHAELPE